MYQSIRGLAVAGTVIITATPATAAELPPPVRAMLDAAIADGDEREVAAVAKFAKSTNPDSKAEIDELVDAYKERIADQKAALAVAEMEKKGSLGLFEAWHLTGELGGFLTTGNSETAGVTAGLTFTKQGLDWRHKIRAFGDYQRSAGVTTRRQWLVSWEPNYTLKEELFAYGLALYEQDRFQGFTDRLTLSGGMGYRAIDTGEMKLDVKGGPAWRRTHWVREPDASELSGLVGADFLWHIAPNIDLTDNAQALWDSNNNTYSNTASLTAKFSETLSARLSYGVRHETKPPPRAKQTDTVTRATIVFGF